MKKDIHPDYHPIKLVLTDGTILNTFSTYGEEGQELRLEVDFKTHAAWTGGGQNIRASDNIKKYEERFKGLNLGTTESA